MEPSGPDAPPLLTGKPSDVEPQDRTRRSSTRGLFPSVSTDTVSTLLCWFNSMLCFTV